MPVSLTVTTRRGGSSAPPYDENNLATHVGDDPRAVAANRAALARAVGARRLLFMDQVHGAAVAVVDADAPAVSPGVDALVTAAPGLALAVLVADCVPVAIWGERAVAVAHAGRRGVQAGVVGATVAAVRHLDPGPLSARLGPSICGRCYEVPAELREEVAAAVPATAATTRWGTPALDLRAGVREQLAAAGVGTVTDDAACTREAAELFSHRRDGVTGRFALVAMRST